MAGRKGEKHWRDALAIAVNEAVEGDPLGRRKLRAIADKLVELALGGDIQAIKEIGDRMDGRAPMDVSIDGEVNLNEQTRHALEEFTGKLARLAARAGTGGTAGEPE